MNLTYKKILVLIASLDVDDSSATKGRVAFIQNFKELGCQVTVLHTTKKEVNIAGVTTQKIKEHKGVFYFLLRLQRYLYRYLNIKIGNTVDKLLGFSFGFFSDRNTFIKALKKIHPDEYDMVWTYGKGNSYTPHAAVLKRKKLHAKWYAFVHDPYPQQLYPRPYNYVPRGYREKRGFFRAMTQKAHRVVFPSLLLKQWMESYYVALAGKSLIIPHQISTIETQDAPFPDYFNPNNFNLLHAGNLLDLRNPKPIVNTFLTFLKQTPEAKKSARLLFLGKNSSFSDYLKKVTSTNASVYVSDGYVPFKQVYKMQQNASVNIILEAQSEISPFLPGKFPHCVHANSPILLVGPYYSECRRLLGEDYPYTFDFDEEKALTDAISTLYDKWKSNKKLTLGAQGVKEYMSKEYLSTCITEDKTV
jgi:glycosyltransferase involved in cell wall biosynthesis